jgi:site-specific recombinase XerD
MVIEDKNIIAKLLDYQKYLQIKNYQESSLKRLVAITKEYEYYQLSNPGSIKEYIDYLQNRNNRVNPKIKLAKSTINGHINGLKVYFTYREEVQGQKNNQKLLYLKKELQAIDYLSIEEVQELFTKADLREKAVIVCLYHLGLRASEAVNLKREHIDFSTNLVFIEKSKTKKKRYVPMNKTAQEILNKYLKTHQQDKALQGLFGDLVTNSLSKILKKLASKAGIKKRVYAHLLRHSIATHLLHQGMKIEQIAQFLGHSTVDSTQRYTHFNY